MEGKNIVIEWRYAEGKFERLPRSRPNWSVSRLTSSSRVVRNQPELPRKRPDDSHRHGAGYDPVGNGFVASLARPGGNITGLASVSGELSGKRLELLKEIVPRLSRVAVLGTFNRTRQRRRLLHKGNGTRRRSVQSADSMPRRTRTQGYMKPHSESQAKNVLTRPRGARCPICSFSQRNRL